MPKPAKPQFGTNAVVPSSKLSALADLADYGASPPICIATRVAVLSLTNSTVTQPGLDTEIVDTASMFAPTSTTITVTDTGIYEVSGWCKIASNTTGMRSLEIYQNGSSVLDTATNAPSSFQYRGTLTSLFVCAAGDTFSLAIFQNSGGALDLLGARLAVVRVSGT